MKKYDYSKLKNGSDIRGIAMEGVPGEAINLGEEETARLTRGFAIWLSRKIESPVSSLKISVGCDSRLTGESLKDVVARTLSDMGATVYDCGLASTPAMFMSTIFPEYACDGAIMITASHLPYNRNGFKYFDRAGGLDKSDIAKIIEYAEYAEYAKYAEYAEYAECAEGEAIGKAQGKAPNGSSCEPKPVERRDLIERYSRHLREMIISHLQDAPDPSNPLAGLKIVVDAGNGAGGFYAKSVLAPLGADISASQFLEPDGRFPNHQPNPENRQAMESILRRVVAAGADLGLIFDTDVDRVSAVDKNGKEIARNAIVAMAASLIAKDYPGTTVVTDSITSDELTVYLTECLGLKHLRYKRGYKNVINKAIELNEAGASCQLAIETSGHAAYRENYFLDDGAYLATRIVIKAASLARSGEGIDVLLSSLGEPKEALEIRFRVAGDDFADYAENILSDLTAWAEAPEQASAGISLAEPNFEGVRLNFSLPDAAGWCLIRKSLHDPIMPLNVEVSKGSCEKILSIIKDFLRKYDRVMIE